MSSKSRVALLPLLAAALLAAGCGGGDDDTPSANDWANEVCSAMTTWIGSTSSAIESLGDGGLSEDGLQDAVDDVRAASETLVDDLQQAGRPDTEAGQEAEALLDGLADDVDENVQELEQTVDDVTGANDVLNAISLITGTLSTMADQVGEAFEQLGQLDAAGELQNAFEESDDCSDLLNGP